MKEKLKRVWARRPRLGRGHRLAVNLLLILLLLVFFWGVAGYPLPTSEMVLRRLEREHLREPAKIAWEWEGLPNVFIGQTETEWETALVYGGGGERYYSFLQYESLEDGPTPVPLTTMHDMQGRELGNSMLFLQIPDRTFRAEVQVTGRSDVELVRAGGVGRTETFEGAQQGDGVWIFWMGESLPDALGDRKTYADALLGLPYTLKLYRADGSLLLEQSGTIPGRP